MLELSLQQMRKKQPQLNAFKKFKIRRNFAHLISILLAVKLHLYADDTILLPNPTLKQIVTKIDSAPKNNYLTEPN